MNKSILSLFLFMCVVEHVFAQTCTYFAYEAFNYAANTAYDGQGGGTGWQYPWDIQNNPTTGFVVQGGAGSLSYGALQTQGRYALGGSAYLTAGRRLNTSDNSTFADYVADYDNGIGTQTGDTLWVSVLLRKDEANDEPVWIDLHNDATAWCNGCASQHIAVGYMGAANSNVGGQRRWTLQLNNNYYTTTTAVTTATPVLAVLRLIFNAGNTNVSLYLNPATLGNNLPASPTLQHNTGAANVLRSAAVYLGDNALSGAIDELRFASRYACVVPDNTISVNLPPTATISATPAVGQAPLSVSLSGAASADPEGQALTYIWNFGDGSATATGVNVSHTYTVLGEIAASLTVTDNLGLSHTAYQTIIIRDSNNTYPCQSSFTVQNMASCGGGNGRITVHADNGATFALRNAANALMPTTSGNEYHNLAAGIYQFTANGGAGGCTDTFALHISVDSTTCAGWQASGCAMEIGSNMSGFADWQVERPMRNLMKHVRSEPISYTPTCNCWSADVLDEMTFDANLYPTHLPQTTSAGSNTVLRYIISSDDANLQIGQQYVFLYDGVGTFTLAAGGTVQSSTAGRIQFTVTSGGNMWFELTASQLGNAARNFRLLRLADEIADLTANPFYQGFLNKIAPYAALRFMDWGATNNSPVTNWANRSTTTQLTYGTEAGVPYEIMIALANATQKDVWICVPHAADDNYVTQMATLFRDSLNPNLNVYLEYSNEVWNWMFGQATYNDQNRPSNLNYGRAYAQKAKRVFDIWHNVYGAQRSRVKRVLGMQVTFNYLNEQILAQLNQDDWDYGSPTFYFGLDHTNSGNPVLHAGSTAQDVMTNARNAWLANKQAFKTDYNQVHLLGKQVINYEGGQHFTDFSVPPYINAMYAAQYSPQMYQMYNEVLDTTRNWGSKLAAHFSLASNQESIYGSWGCLDDIDIAPPYMTTAPKFQALLDNAPVIPNPIISGSANICAQTTQTYSVPVVAGNTYQWTVTGGTITAGQGTSQISVQWNNNSTGTVTVVQTNP